MTRIELQSLKREVILALFADNALMQQLVLKDGNLLDVVYGISTRPSRDIDLSICGSVEDLDRFKGIIEQALRTWFEGKGYVVFDVNLREEPKVVTEEFRAFWGGYKVDFKIINAETYQDLAGDPAKLRKHAMTVVDDHGKRFPIEISKHEYIDEKVAEIVDDLTVYAYSPGMLVAEKLRAICQQMPKYTSYLRKHASPRRRDFLDIHTVAEYFRVDFGSPAFHQTLRKVFQAKRVDLSLLAKIADQATKEYHRPDFVSIAPTVRPGTELQDFDFYYSYVVEKCQGLLALPNAEYKLTSQAIDHADLVDKFLLVVESSSSAPWMAALAGDWLLAEECAKHEEDRFLQELTKMRAESCAEVRLSFSLRQIAGRPQDSSGGVAQSAPAA